MTRQITILVSETTQLPEKIIDYFKQFDFKLIGNESGSLKFSRSAALLDAWKTNPLKWGSEISVSILNNNVIGNFYIDTDAQMNTREEKVVWQTFIENFEHYLKTGLSNNLKLNATIAESKKSRISYIGWSILGALCGSLLSYVYNSQTQTSSTLGLLLIPILASIFLVWRIRYSKIDNAL